VRARINVLSEIPALWRLKLRRWRDWNRGKKRLLDGRPVPTRNDEYLLYQTLVGVWPVETLDDVGWRAFSARIEQYMLKAAREAKEQTSWANSNLDYEGALLNFTRAVLKRQGKNSFLADFAQFQQQTARIGMFNSLSQCLLKLTSPGVPDIYQGNELWELNLVDPDNRRSVDYDRRRQLLHDLRRGSQSPQQLSAQAGALLANMDDSLAKLYLTWRTLEIRRDKPLLFQQGSYIPLQAAGERSEHICAFAREYEGQSVIVVVPRLCATLLGQDFSSPCADSLWSDTQLQIPDAKATCYHQAFTGECIPLGDNQEHCSLPVARLLRDFPVAFLFSEPLT
jgi:(1->4)-alpha-D-glucan 1-alpha-D-glucosylmutase